MSCGHAPYAATLAGTTSTAPMTATAWPAASAAATPGPPPTPAGAPKCCLACPPDRPGVGLHDQTASRQHAVVPNAPYYRRERSQAQHEMCVTRPAFMFGGAFLASSGWES